nr:MAG TPA: hypothetical protein [Caudoviricetes sp.]
MLLAQNQPHLFSSSINIIAPFWLLVNFIRQICSKKFRFGAKSAILKP